MTISTTTYARHEEEDHGLPENNVAVKSLHESTRPDVEALAEDQAPVVAQDNVPPNGGYGWVVTICLFLINAHTWGVNSAWAVFLSHYLEDSVFPGATQLEYALIGGLSISQSLLIAPVVAISNRKFGTRMTLLIGTTLVFVALFGASFSTQIWHLFLSQGFCFGWGMGFLYITATAVLPQWFSTKRSLALGLASSGAGLGGLVYNLGAGAGADSLGLPWTYRILAFCTLAVNGLCAMLIKDRNSTVKSSQRAFDYKEFGRIEVILIIIWGFATELGYIVLLYSLPHYATSIGLSQSQGSVVGAILNLGMGVARPFVGHCSDRFGRINVASLMTAFCGIVCLAIWIPAKTYATLLVFALLAGTSCGTFWATTASVTAEVVGLQRLPSSFGMICLSLVLPTTFAEPIGLQIVSVSGYLSSQIFVACMFLLGAAATWFLRSWKVSDVEQKTLTDSDGENKDAAIAASVLNRKHSFWLTPRGLFSVRQV